MPKAKTLKFFKEIASIIKNTNHNSLTPEIMNELLANDIAYRADIVNIYDNHHKEKTKYLYKTYELIHDNDADFFIIYLTIQLTRTYSMKLTLATDKEIALNRYKNSNDLIDIYTNIIKNYMVLNKNKKGIESIEWLNE